MTTTVEVRCPVGPRKLFTKLKLGEEIGRVTAGNLLELSCSDCRRRLNRYASGEFVSILHRYNFVGVLIETTGIHADGSEQLVSVPEVDLP